MNTVKPLVSVLITAYNREKYIAEAIESVLASTYSNFELIILDDSSTDRTVEIAKQYSVNDHRVKVYINESNLGDYPNRNKAATYASGKYIKYVDSDDYIYPWGLEILVNIMERFPDAGWGLCSLVQVREKPYPLFLNSREAYEHHYLRNDIFFKAPLSSIIKKDVFEKEGGFKNNRMTGDYEMWHRLALRNSVVLINDGIVWNREHEGQEVQSSRKYLFEYEAIKEAYLRRSDCPLDASTIRMIKQQRIKTLLRTSIGALVRFRFRSSWDLARLFMYNVIVYYR